MGCFAQRQLALVDYALPLLLLLLTADGISSSCRVPVLHIARHNYICTEYNCAKPLHTKQVVRATITSQARTTCNSPRLYFSLSLYMGVMDSGGRPGSRSEASRSRAERQTLVTLAYKARAVGCFCHEVFFLQTLACWRNYVVCTSLDRR